MSVPPYVCLLEAGVLSKQQKDRAVLFGTERKVKVMQCSGLCYKHRTATGACMRCWIIQSYLPPDRGSTPALTTAVIGQYSIYPPIKDERLSRPEPTQANDLPRVATEVPAIPGVSWLSRPSVPLGMVGVNN